MPVLKELNDEQCLGTLHEHSIAFSKTPEAREYAARVGHVGALIEDIRNRPQRDDTGDPADGPRVACNVMQRLRFLAPDPSCYERSGDFIAIAPLIDPDLNVTTATVQFDEGLHTFPVIIRNGIPEIVVLDPYAAPPLNTMVATAYELRNASPLASDQIGPWFVEVARNACIEDGGFEHYQDAMASLRQGLLTGEPMVDTEALAYVLGRALADAVLFGPSGRAAYHRVRHSLRNLSNALDLGKVTKILDKIVGKGEDIAPKALKAALVAQFGPAAQIALHGLELAVTEDKPDKPETASDDKAEGDTSKAESSAAEQTGTLGLALESSAQPDGATTKEDRRRQARANLRRMTAGFRR